MTSSAAHGARKDWGRENTSVASTHARTAAAAVFTSWSASVHSSGSRSPAAIFPMRPLCPPGPYDDLAGILARDVHAVPPRRRRTAARPPAWLQRHVADVGAR